MRVALFIEYHSHRTLLIVPVKVRVIIRLHHCFGCHISSYLIGFARVITAIIKLTSLELKFKLQNSLGLVQ